MKKILQILVILPLFSACVYKNQEIALKFDLGTQISEIGKGIGVRVSAVDKRPNKVLGQKIYLGENVVDVDFDRELGDFLAKKLMHSLVDRGFQYGGGKRVELQIRELSYHVESSLIAKAKIDGLIKVVVRDGATKRVFSKKYGAKTEKTYFVMPLKSMVRDSVNEFLRDLVNDIAKDEVFLAELLRS